MNSKFYIDQSWIERAKAVTLRRFLPERNFCRQLSRCTDQQPVSLYKQRVLTLLITGGCWILTNRWVRLSSHRISSVAQRLRQPIQLRTGRPTLHHPNFFKAQSNPGRNKPDKVINPIYYLQVKTYPSWNKHQHILEPTNLCRMVIAAFLVLQILRVFNVIRRVQFTKDTAGIV